MSQEPVDLLIEARWVLPIAPVNIALADHAVAVNAGRIVALGPVGQMSQRFEPRQRVARSDHHVLIPGLVNAHTRAAMTLLRGLPVEGPRERWTRDTVHPVERRVISADFVRDGTQLAIAEMLRSGITSFADSYLFPEEVARAAAGARMRAAVGLPVSDKANAWAEDATAHFAKAEKLWDEYKSDPWVCLHFAPQTADEISDGTLERLRRVADELDARVAMAVHETIGEVSNSLSMYGRRPLRRLQELGLLRPGFTALHLNHLDAEDVEIAATNGLCAVACLQSDLRLGSGVCPMQQLEDQQITVGLGTGDPASNGALDILEQARLAVLMENGANKATRPLTAGSALRRATMGGATALGLGSLVGSIEPGKAADLACFDLRGLACWPDAGPANSLLFGASRPRASDVWTSGRAAVSGGQLLALDEGELASVADQWARRMQAGEGT